MCVCVYVHPCLCVYVCVCVREREREREMERVHLKERWMQDSAFHCSIKQKDGFEDTDVCVRERKGSCLGEVDALITIVAERWLVKY